MNTLLLKSARVKMGYTQSDVAEKTGMTLKSYNEKENGKSIFNISEAKQLKEILNLTRDEISEIFFETN